jgi:hypothetical protein
MALTTRSIDHRNQPKFPTCLLEAMPQEQDPEVTGKKLVRMPDEQDPAGIASHTTKQAPLS